MVLPVDPHLYATFLGVMAVMAITPGPANVFSVANGVQRGKAGALLGVVGMNAATLVWFGAAALGLGALVIAVAGGVAIFAGWLLLATAAVGLLVYSTGWPWTWAAALTGGTSGTVSMAASLRR